MKKMNFSILTILLLYGASLFAQNVTKVGTTAAGFLNIDVGAKPVSMGSAYVSRADDVTSMYWNPAGIARLTNSQAMFSYTQWIHDVSFNYAGVAVPIKSAGVLGANATFLTMPDLERTTINEPDGTGELYGAGSYAFGLTFATGLTDRFSIGMNLKYVREEIYHTYSQGVAIDIGTLYETPFNGLTFGMSISNFGTKLKLSGQDLLTQTDIDPSIYGNNPNINSNLDTGEFDMPLMFRFGISMDVLKGSGNSNFIVAVDALHPSDDVESLNLGGEYVLKNTFSLRAGYKNLFAEDSEEGLSLGAGLKYSFGANADIVVDFAYLDFGALDNIQIFTFGLNF